MKTTALAPWFGSNRMLAEHVGEALRGCEWVGIPFAGGCCEVPHIKARTIVVNDLHRHLMILCRVVAATPSSLKIALQDAPFHPDVLARAQITCRDATASDFEVAVAYFICCWMTRSGSAGTPSEFTGNLCLRWNAGGGDSNVRFRSAIDSLEEWHRIFVDRCTFSTLDCFDFLDKCKDQPGHGIYCDPPFLIAGQKYTHNAGKGRDEIVWHQRLADQLLREKCRVVVRAYDVPLIRNLYPTHLGWQFRELTGRKQTNDAAPELLIVRN